MHRLLTTFLACSIATAVLAADAPVLVQVTISDGPRLIAHHRANVIGVLLYDPALAALTDRLRTFPVLGTDPGVSSFALWEALANAQVTLHGLAADATVEDIAAWKREPDYHIQAGLGAIGERYFVAYAWPIDEDQGRKAFAITHAGMVYMIPAHQLDGKEPAWNTVFGGEGKGWQDQPVWPLHQRRDGGPRPEPKQKPEKPEDAPAF
ncbi:MAG: hypothetical protein H0W78_06520 [Planctomycetes bacterium]|nr:hypothetical protein [Planctomycetota bacterium]